MLHSTSNAISVQNVRSGMWFDVIAHYAAEIPNEASLCQVVRAVFLRARDVLFLPVRGSSRRVVSGPGVACPKSRHSGCEPAALATESFPACPPGLQALPAARAAP